MFFSIFYFFLTLVKSNSTKAAVRKKTHTLSEVMDGADFFVAQSIDSHTVVYSFALSLSKPSLLSHQ